MDSLTQTAETPEGRRPERMFRMQEYAHWHAAGAVVVTMLLYLNLPESLTVGQNWHVLIPEVALLPPLLITTNVHRERQDSLWHRLVYLALSDESPFQRTVVLILIGVINAANVGSLVLLANDVLYSRITSGSELVLSGAQIWLTNVIVFGLWYWEFDRGGPASRALAPKSAPDFLFPQEANPEAAPIGWRPGFIDYLYLAYTNATAFSPTDTMPLAGWAKLLMAIQALVSLITAVLVISRAVNILT